MNDYNLNPTDINNLQDAGWNGDDLVFQLAGDGWRDVQFTDEELREWLQLFEDVGCKPGFKITIRPGITVERLYKPQQ